MEVLVLMDSRVFEVSRALTGRQEMLGILAMKVSLVWLASLATQAVVEQLGRRAPWATLGVLGILGHLVSQVLQVMLDKSDLLVRQTAAVLDISNVFPLRDYYKNVYKWFLFQKAKWCSIIMQTNLVVRQWSVQDQTHYRGNSTKQIWTL